MFECIGMIASHDALRTTAINELQRSFQYDFSAAAQCTARKVSIWHAKGEQAHQPRSDDLIHLLQLFTGRVARLTQNRRIAPCLLGSSHRDCFARCPAGPETYALGPHAGYI